jgi:hypothetical protein
LLGFSSPACVFLHPGDTLFPVDRSPNRQDTLSVAYCTSSITLLPVTTWSLSPGNFYAERSLHGASEPYRSSAPVGTIIPSNA